MWNQEAKMASISCCFLLGRRWATALFSRDHKFSIGFRSGLFPGQSNTATFLAANYFLQRCAVWQGAPSCWKINGSVPNRSRAECRSFGSKISPMYLEALMFPFSTCILPTPDADIQPQIMTDIGCFMVGVMHCGRPSSPGRLRTYRTPSLPKMEIFVSSLHKTHFHSSAPQLICSLAQSTRFCLWMLFRNGFLRGIRAFSPAEQRRRRTVRLDTETPASPKTLLRSPDVVLWFANTIRTILLSVAAVVDFFLPLPGWLSTDAVVSKRLHSFRMPEAVTLSPIFAAIAR